MGKMLDRLSLFIISVAGFYFFFLNAWGSILLACFLSFFCCILINHLLRRRPHVYRCSRRRAEAEIMRIACLSEDDAKEYMDKVLRTKYPEEVFEVIPILKHPSSSISTGDIFAIWKKHSGDSNLVVCCTCFFTVRLCTIGKEGSFRIDVHMLK